MKKKPEATKFEIEEINASEIPVQVRGQNSELYNKVYNLKKDKGLKVHCDKQTANSVRTTVYRQHPDKYDIFYQQGFMYARLNPLKD